MSDEKDAGLCLAEEAPAFDQVPSDLIGGIFALMSEDRIEAPCGSLHKAFFQLREEFSMLKFLTFSDTGGKPFSPNLDKILSLLQRSRILGAENPEYCVTFVTKNGRETIKKEVLAKLPDDRLQELWQAAQRLQQILNESPARISSKP